MPNFKHIESSLNVLHELRQDRTVVLHKPMSSLDGTGADMKKSNLKGYTVIISDPAHQFSSLGDITDIGWEFSDKKFSSDRIFPISTDTNKVVAEVSWFSSIGFDRTAKVPYRLIIPFDGDLYFHFFLSRTIFSTQYAGLNKRSRECVTVYYDQGLLDVYIFRDTTRNEAFLILDCECPIDFDEFSELTFSTLVSIGFVTGRLVQNEGYFFAYEDAQMDAPTGIYYGEFRSSIKSLYHPIYANPYGYIRDRDIVKVEQVGIRVLSKKEFSALCRKAYSSERFRSVLLLIVEATVSSQLLKPAALSVALEALTAFFVGEHPDRFLPIPDKTLASKFRGELLEILKRYQTLLDNDGNKILKGILENINRPTTSVQLHKPFSLLEFELTQEDISAITHRNDFLHGRVTLLKLNDEGHEVSDFEEPFRHIHYTALRLYTLLAILILRSVGFGGKIVNFPKTQENVRGESVDEPYFRRIKREKQLKDLF